MRAITSFVIALIFVLGVGCASKPKQNLTPMQIQQIQSRTFEAEYDVTFRSVVSVFQDLGYTIKSADISTGFITAESAAKSDDAAKFWTGSTKVDQTAATGFVEAVGRKTLVRLNFVNRVETSTQHGRNDKDETPVYAPEPYQIAFERIENAIFVRTSTR